jgi:ribosomal RNA-processing protein 36
MHSRLAQVEPESDDEAASEQEPDNDSGEFDLSREEAKSISSGCEPNFGEDNQDIDVDAPRVAQWEPDEFESDDSRDENDSGDDEKITPRRAGSSNLQLVRSSLLRRRAMLIPYATDIPSGRFVFAAPNKIFY